MFSAYFIRKPMGMMKMALERDLAMSNFQLGIMDICFLLPYSLIQVFGSSRFDDFAVHKLTALTLITTSLATVAWCLVSSPFQLYLLLIISGMAQGPQWPTAVKLATTGSQSNVPRTIGLLSTALFAGAFVGTGVSVLILDLNNPGILFQSQNWRFLVIVLGAPGILIGIYSYFFTSLGTTTTTTITTSTKDMDLRKIMRIETVPEITITLLLLKSVRFALYFWLPIYAVEHLKLKYVEAGFLSVSFDVGGLLSGPVIGFYVNQSKGKHLSFVTKTCAFSVAILAVFAITSNYYLIQIMLAILGIFVAGADTVLSGTIPREIGEQHGVPAGVTAFVNGVSGLGAALEGPIMGGASESLGIGLKTVPVFFVIFSGLAFFTSLKAQHSWNKHQKSSALSPTV